ncbi:ABC transporter substrate-binding protein [Chromohalobacter sp. HP20-39]|uniref:ABC transporter substrate-binding protein n=1 Tax=Chromohalobacter sp. HP20-39 TaxID=3079306 RepID=UPI00294B3417|nr:ABC transporter substrate-binding protein [Chromohalobacter sp. HP20-39]MDV6320157.1 ABC transporter substrate-binding protein [Chromohalobacter sp. HP20-39]
MTAPCRWLAHWSLALAGILLSAITLADAHVLRYPATQSPAQPLEIYGALDNQLIAPLLADFHARHPEIELVYRNLTTLALYRRFMSTDATPADVIMSSAMPWQYQIANRGLAKPLDTAAARAWPEASRWRHELFGFTFEPVVIVYRRDALAGATPPDSHEALLRLLTNQRQRLKGRVVTYDPWRSGAGYTYATEDANMSPRYWELVAALGGVDAALADTTGEMLDGLADGRYAVGYNLLGSYARDFVADHPQLEMVIPNDYALVTQRLVLIPKRAPHPDTAERFVDYLLSRQGQQVIRDKTPLGAIHTALEGEGTARDLRKTLGDALHPIAIDPSLLATLDTLKRHSLLDRWQREYTRLSDSGS